MISSRFVPEYSSLPGGLPHQTKGCPPVEPEEQHDILRQLEGARALPPECARDRAGWMADQPVSGLSLVGLGSIGVPCAVGFPRER